MISRLWSENFDEVSKDIDNEGHAEYWLKGGRGSGKSTFVARKLLLGLAAHPGACALVCRKVAATLRQSVFAELARAADALGLSPWCEFRLSPLEIRLSGGQRILFRGADDPGKTKSIALREGYFGFLWFEELSEFIRETRFDRLGCFAYSAEEGTPAARMDAQVDDEEKQRREELVMELQMTIMAEENEKRVGQVLEVITEGYDRYGECFFGRSAYDAPEIDGKIYFTAEKRPAMGDYVKVRIDEVMDCDLIGEAI